MSQCFETRYETGYLEKLSELLDVKQLKETAVAYDREDLWKSHTISGTKEKILLKRAIKIDFAGIACCTLLGTNKALNPDIQKLYPAKYREIMELRERIEMQFKSLFTDAIIKDINDSGIFLQVRICFPYLFSDFPISLMRAEKSHIWRGKTDSDIDFWDNSPIDEDEWSRSNIYRAQMDSLNEIVTLCEKHPFLCRVYNYHDATNTLETRFAVIPIPNCVLIINDMAITDSYVYAKVNDEKHLAFNTPVNIISQHNKDGKENIGYTVLRQNFLYIWRHDLTLYADMATEFTEKTPGGLIKLRVPFKPGRKRESNIEWQKKIERMAAKKASRDRKYDRNHPDEQKRIELWTANVILKMDACTRKIHHKVKVLDSKDIHVTIKKRRDHCTLTIHHVSDLIFEFERNQTTVAFCVIANLAYSQKNGGNGRICRHYKPPARLKREIIDEFKSEDRLKNKDIANGQVLFDSLFAIEDGHKWRLKIPAENITFEEKDIQNVRDTVYLLPNGKKTNCIDG